MGSVSRRLRRNQIKKFMRDKGYPFQSIGADGKKINHLKEWFAKAGDSQVFRAWKLPFEKECAKRTKLFEAKKRARRPA